MSIRVKQDVFRLEVAVDNVERVQVIKRERDLCRVELGDRIWKALIDNRILMNSTHSGF